MACPTGFIAGCDFGQFLVSETPRFDELIMEDIRVSDSWLGNVSTGTSPMGTPAEITQDRFRHVWPNTTKPWRRVASAGVGCTGNPCDPPAHQIGWGADRLTYYTEETTFETPLLCYDQEMHVTHAEQHLAQIINDILRPATSAIASMFLRKRALLWAKYLQVANSAMSSFTFQWNLDANGNEVFFDTNANPNNVFHLVPQMLQFNFNLSMLEGYAGKNPFKETAPFIELVTDMESLWFLDRLGGQQGVGGGDLPNTAANWRFTNWDAASDYWRYGFTGQIGNYMARADMMGLRFNFVTDLGAGANGGNGNRFRYQLLLPYTNGISSGAGGAAGLGDSPNIAFQNAHFSISFQWHKKGMELLTPDARPINPEMPYMHRDFGGKWQFLMNNLGADVNGVAINNKWGNKGQFAAWFKYLIRPLHTEFIRAYFHAREPMCIPNVGFCSADPGYPSQVYSSTLPACPLPANFTPVFGQGVPAAGPDLPDLPNPVPPDPDI